MAAQEARRHDAGSEVERLRRELAAVRQRLQDEVAYYQAETESTRQRVESEHLRLNAQEVARRREVEEQLARAETELREVRERADRLQRRYDELNRQYLQQEESARVEAEEQVTQTQAAARAAWQSAEEELAAMESDRDEARRALAAEQERSRQLEETLGSLQGLGEAGSEDREAALLDEVTALRKALSLSERGRGQANQRAVRLAEKLVAMQAQHQEASAKPADGGAAAGWRSARTGAGNPAAVDLSEANAVLRAAHGPSHGDGEGADSPVDALGAELADEFQLIQADTSLDRARVQRLQEHVDKEDAREADRRREKARQRASTAAAFPERPQPATPEPDPRAADPAPGAEPVTARTAPRWPTLAGLAVLLGALGGGVVWFLGGAG